MVAYFGWFDTNKIQTNNNMKLPISGMDQDPLYLSENWWKTFSRCKDDATGSFEDIVL